MLSAFELCLERYFEPVFQPLSFELEAGGLLLVTGANGSGKTTLIRLLAGILMPSSGTFRSNATGTAYVGHQLAIKDDLSVSENLRFVRDFQGGTKGDCETVIDRMGLRRVAGQLARTLSAGQRKRCALARLLLADAELWLLDEPYSNLDQEGVALVDAMLAGHLDSGGACVLATHGAHRPDVPVFEERHLISGATGR